MSNSTIETKRVAGPKEKIALAALERLIAVAKRDTGQSRKVANFLLAWWSASENGGFDITDAWALDGELKTDLLYVFALAVSSHSYPDTLGYKKDFEQIWERWRGPVTRPFACRRCRVIHSAACPLAEASR